MVQIGSGTLGHLGDRIEHIQVVTGTGRNVDRAHRAPDLQILLPIRPAELPVRPQIIGDHLNALLDARKITGPLFLQRSCY